MPSEPDFPESELIANLCLEAGRIMEDASPELALRLPDRTDAIQMRLSRARQAGEDIASIMAAAQALQRRRSET